METVEVLDLAVRDEWRQTGKIDCRGSTLTKRLFGHSFESVLGNFSITNEGGKIQDVDIWALNKTTKKMEVCCYCFNIWTVAAA